jgi:hypothetical protein
MRRHSLISEDGTEIGCMIMIVVVVLLVLMAIS